MSSLDWISILFEKKVLWTKRTTKSLLPFISVFYSNSLSFFGLEVTQEGNTRKEMMMNNNCFLTFISFLLDVQVSSGR